MRCRQKIQAIFNHAAAYRAHAAALKKTINTVFWDENDEFYYDRNEKTGARIRVKSVAGFVPLWAGVASLKQAERLVKEHLLFHTSSGSSIPSPATPGLRRTTIKAHIMNAIGAARPGYRSTT